MNTTNEKQAEAVSPNLAQSPLAITKQNITLQVSKWQMGMFHMWDCVQSGPIIWRNRS